MGRGSGQVAVVNCIPRDSATQTSHPSGYLGYFELGGKRRKVSTTEVGKYSSEQGLPRSEPGLRDLVQIWSCEVSEGGQTRCQVLGRTCKCDETRQGRRPMTQLRWVERERPLNQTAAEPVMAVQASSTQRASSDDAKKAASRR